MIDTSQMDFLTVAAIAFMPMFICGMLLRAKGVLGLLAVVGIVAVFAELFYDFRDWRLAAGGMAALVGLFAGGKISDKMELKRMMREKEEERRKRDARLKAR